MLAINLRLGSKQASKIGNSTFHSELTANSGGATGLSVCPRNEPVKRLSRSITTPNNLTSVRILDILSDYMAE